jgi:carbonic anhydrase
METYKRLLLNNKAWVEDKMNLRPDYFARTSGTQKPEFLWIGCSDSRVPAEEVTGVEPGELFVHRNIANLVVHTDFNMLSVVQYAVEVLKVKHIIVCGHYGCGGVKAAVDGQRRGLVDHWLHPIRELRHTHREELDSILDARSMLDRLCELNVIRQVRNVASDVFVHEAWTRGQALAVHGWVYSLANGLVRDLDATVSRIEELDKLHNFTKRPSAGAPPNY